VKSMTFSDGTTIELEPSDVVVFVGPNNAGKSRVLVDIKEAFSKREGKVSPHIELDRSGSPSELKEYLASEARTYDDGSGRPTYRGLNYSIREDGIPYAFLEDANTLLPFFCAVIGTENRLRDANSVESLFPAITCTWPSRKIK